MNTVSYALYKLCHLRCKFTNLRIPADSNRLNYLRLVEAKHFKVERNQWRNRTCAKDSVLVRVRHSHGPPLPGSATPRVHHSQGEPLYSVSEHFINPTSVSANH